MVPICNITFVLGRDVYCQTWFPICPQKAKFPDSLDRRVKIEHNEIDVLNLVIENCQLKLMYFLNTLAYSSTINNCNKASLFIYYLDYFDHQFCQDLVSTKYI